MPEPYLGQLSLFPFGYAPVGWAPCNGQVMPIQTNAALFSLLGVSFGGDGQRTFGLPDLRGRVAKSQGAGPGLQPTTIGEMTGVETVTLTAAQLPAHTHALGAYASAATTGTAPGALIAEGAGGGGRGGYAVDTYAAGGAPTTLAPTQLTPIGSGGAHNNLQPYLALTWCIAMQGIYPPRP